MLLGERWEGKDLLVRFGTANAGLHTDEPEPPLLNIRYVPNHLTRTLALNLLLILQWYKGIGLLCWLPPIRSTKALKYI
jgi:hypothetical protein